MSIFINEKGQCPICLKEAIIRTTDMPHTKRQVKICENEYGKHIRTRGEDFYIELAPDFVPMFK
jgi:hypothetical protein